MLTGIYCINSVYMSHRGEATSKHPQGANYRFVTACNENATYTGFIPTWIDHHKKLFPESDILVLLVSKNLPYELEKYKSNIIVVDPIPNVHTAYQAQMIRLLYPVLLEDKQNIICDIDMYILSKDVLVLFQRIPNNDTRFINFGCLDIASCHKEKQLPLFFSVYGKKVLENVFKVKNKEDITNLMLDRYEKQNNPYGYNWFADQVLLYELFINYDSLFKIERKTGDRIDRDWFNPSDPQVVYKIKNNCLVDFHAPRPYQKYKSFIQSVLDHVIYAP